MIEVTIDSPNLDLTAQWDDLVSRAQPNVFMSPAALKAASETLFAQVHLLLAWDDDGGVRRLVGLWALQKRRVFPVWPAILEALPYEYAFLCNPVVDTVLTNAVMLAFLDAIAINTDFPRVILLKSFNGDAPDYEAFVRALEARGRQCLTLRTATRPIISRNMIVKRMGERRKKLRQNWRRLCERGTTEYVSDTEPMAVAAGLETFLQLEFKSWKGEEGTALLCSRADATFARRLVAGLADNRQVRVHKLQIDGRAIAALISFTSGSVGYTWKMGYDPAYGKYSPGAILLEKVTEELLALPGIETIDSCSDEGSFVSNIWAGRRTMIDMMVDVGEGTSLPFVLERARQHAIRTLRRLRDRFRAAMNERKREKSVVGTPPPHPVA